MSKSTGSPIPFLKGAGVPIVAILIVIFLTVDFREIYLKSWMFELFNPTHSVELNVSRVK